MMYKYMSDVPLGDDIKAAVPRLREIPVGKVLEVFQERHFPEEILHNGKKCRVRNAIDFLVYHKGCPYSGAIQFLWDHFSHDMQDMKEEKQELSEADKIKVSAIRKQFQALGMPLVRVTCLHIESDTPIVVGKGKGKNPESEMHDCRGITTRLLHMLAGKNADNFNIYIMPLEYAPETPYIYVLVDDVFGLRGMELWKEAGAPNLILETSAHNFQYVYNLSKAPLDFTTGGKKAYDKSRRKFINLFTFLNRKYGDAPITGLRHSFRLAGFANKKAGRDSYWTKVVSANPVVTHRLDALVQEPVFASPAEKFEKWLETIGLGKEEAIQAAKKAKEIDNTIADGVLHTTANKKNQEYQQKQLFRMSL